jgi:ABC-type transport system involved in cytochrome c biogenesis ATPase subunit
VLRAEGLTVARGRRVLLENFSIEFAQNEIVRVAGPNGCGKSSLLRVLAGVVEPRRGRVVRDVACAFVPERLVLPDSLPARRWLRLSGAGEARLPSALDAHCGTLSKGQLQRVVLTGVLGGPRRRPSILFLDEPWAGLAQGARAALDHELSEEAAGGSTVVYTDHSGATGLSPTRTVQLAPNMDTATEAPSATVRIELIRGDERTHITIAESDLAARLSDGWEIDRVDPRS